DRVERLRVRPPGLQPRDRVLQSLRDRPGLQHRPEGAGTRDVVRAGCRPGAADRHRTEELTAGFSLADRPSPAPAVTPAAARPAGTRTYCRFAGNSRSAPEQPRRAATRDPSRAPAPR